MLFLGVSVPFPLPLEGSPCPWLPHPCPAAFPSSCRAGIRGKISRARQERRPWCLCLGRALGELFQPGKSGCRAGSRAWQGCRVPREVKRAEEAGAAG